MKSEKCEKWFFAIFQLEPTAVQAVPAKIGGMQFSDFSKNSRGYMGGAKIGPKASQTDAIGHSANKTYARCLL
jgi:hypothetical protein